MPEIPADAICVFRDGDQWCAVRADFINLQESDAGFGPTVADAIAALDRRERDGWNWSLFAAGALAGALLAVVLILLLSKLN